MDRLIAWLRPEAQRAVGWTLALVGAVLLVLTYLSVDSEPTIVSQLADLVGGGLGGLLVLGTGLAAIVFVDLTDEWHKLDRIEAALAGSPPPGRVDLRAVRAPIMVGVIGLGIGVAVLLVGWNRAADAADPSAAFRAVGVGIAGLITGALAVAVSTFWCLRTVRLRASRLFAPWLIVDMQTRAVAGGVMRTSLRPAPALVAPESVLVGTGLRRFHAASCAVVAAGGRYTSVAMSAVDPELAPCGLCLPDLPEHGSRGERAGADILEGATSR